MFQLNRTIEVNGQKIDATINIEILEGLQDDYDVCMDVDFETPEAKVEYAKKFENGELFAASIIVRATALGLDGVDSLGGVALVPNNMFDSKPFESSVFEYLNEYGLIENALAELKQVLETEYTRLMEQASKFKAYSKG